MTQELEKLLGGYATNTLTEEERKALFEAALDHQQLFNALADEEALKELLEDPQSRERLLEVLAHAPETPQGRTARLFQWFRRPFNLTLAGGLAAAAVAVFVLVNLVRETPDRIAPTAISGQKAERPPARTASKPEPGKAAERRGIPAFEPSPAPDIALQSRPAHRVRKQAPEADLLDSVQPGSGRYAFVLAQPLAEGPARQLYDTRTGLEEPRTGAAASRQSSLNDEPMAPAAAAERKAATASRPAEPGSAGRAHAGRLGLRLGLQKEGTGGAYTGVGFTTPLGEQDEIRLTVEPNTDGYLYVAQSRGGKWHWLSASSGDFRSEITGARIVRGQTINVPLRSVDGLAQDPDANRLLIILSRNEIHEAPLTASPSLGRKPGVGNVRESLEGWRSTSDHPILREEGPDKTLYLVSDVPTPAAPLVIELLAERL